MKRTKKISTSILAAVLVFLMFYCFYSLLTYADPSQDIKLGYDSN